MRLRDAQSGIASIASMHDSVLLQTEAIGRELRGTRDKLMGLVHEVRSHALELRQLETVQKSST